MSESTVQEPVSEITPTDLKPKRRFDTKKTKNGPPPKKAGKLKAEAKPSKNGRDENQAFVLSFQQVRILKALIKHENGLNRKDISDKANVHSLTEHLGPIHKEQIEETEKRSGRKTLLGLKMSKCSLNSLDDQDYPIYQVTADGRKAIEVLNKSLTWPSGH